MRWFEDVQKSSLPKPSRNIPFAWRKSNSDPDLKYVQDPVTAYLKW